VLTARHCVAPVLNEVNGDVSCTTTTFGATDPASGFYVTTRAVMDMVASDYHVIQKVVTPPDGTRLCGFDQAILILSEPIDPSEAVPLIPRVDTPLATGDGYSAIGYGGTDNNGTGVGERRRRDTLFVSCVGAECPADAVKPSEFIGDTGICEGDSGGPALDLAGRVVGVTSRGGKNCTSPVYGAVYGLGQWIRDTTTEAATLGGYPPPAWATGAPTDPQYSAPVGTACTQPSDCASGRCVADANSRYCTRLCDLADCPTGFTCDSTDPVSPICIQVPPAPASPPKSASGTAAHATQPSSASSCSVAAPGRAPALPVAWLASAAGLAALAVRRRRRR
jgi:MYXO-CTERM domain-containing protein